mmetsp:Transcript_3023/g.9072  ORF Transcript_3023/g.9072 Transcript_3023/m.9072 type:complete len:4073 (+) Transcript_3023:47-12265(+)
MDPPKSPFRRPPRVTASPDHEAYPTLLDSAQWTQAATFNQDERFSGPSNRIGRYYRQKLDELDEAQLDAKRAQRLQPASPLRPVVERKGWAAGLVCKPLLTPLEASQGDSGGFGSSSSGQNGSDFSAFALLSRQRASAEAEERAIFDGTQRQAHITDPDALQARFDEYVKHGVDESSLAPFNKMWAIHAMEQVPRELAGLPPEAIDSRLNQMLHEVSDLYYTAVKRSMVAYVLRNPVEAKRLEITIPPKPFEHKIFHPAQDPSVADFARPTAPDSLALGLWHESVLTGYESIERTLLINHDGMLQMLDLWTLYHHLLLCSVSAPPPVAALELDRFKDQQHAHCEKVVQMLKKKWFPAVVDIFKAEGVAYESEDETRATPHPLLGVVSALMFNQLRGLLSASVEAYVSFVERYATRPDGSVLKDDESALTSEAVDQRPLILVRMLVEGDGFKFSPSASTMAKAMISILDHFVAMINTIPRIETEIGRAGAANGAKYLTVATVDEELMTLAKQRLQVVVEANMELTDAMVRAYSPYAYLLTTETEAKVDDFCATKHSLQEASLEIAKFDRAAKDAVKCTVPEVRFNLVLAASQAVSSKLSSRAIDMAGRIRMTVGNSFLEKNADMCARYQEIYLRLGEHPTTEEEMVKLEKFVAESAGLLQKLNGELNEGRKALRFLVEQAYHLDEEQLRLVGETWAWPGKVKPKVEECNKRLKAERDRVEDELTLRRDSFVAECEGFITQANAFEKLGDIGRVAENATALADLNDAIKDAKARGQAINEEEELLGFPITQFPQLAEVPAILAPYQTLWNTANDFQKSSFEWMHGSMKEVDPEVLDSEVKAMWKSNFKIIKVFSEDGMPEAPLKVAEQLKGRIDEFQQKIPLISALCNKGMRDRHWERVSEVVGKPFKPTDSTTLASILTPTLEAKLPALEEISASASKEFSLEKALDKMHTDWQPLEFITLEYRDTGTHIIGGIDEIQLLLDDHLVKAQTMLGSPFIKPFETRAKKWAEQLSLIQDLIDMWLKVQGMWQYLEPIFGSADIMRQMPKEGALFKKQDGMWRENAKKVLQDVHVLAVSEIPGLLESYTEQHNLLELVQKGLNEYLEMKRLYFPRFFFLSNDEMLEILSETKDPTRVQPHLGKCFDGIGKLQFEGEKNVITAMSSAEGELVSFADAKITPSAMVEQWLLEVETQMFASVARVCNEGADAYRKMPRHEWVTKWQAQVVLTVTVMMWTLDVDEALLAKGNAGLHEYGKKCAADLDEVVKLVRGDLPKLTRKTLAPLIVMDVHARDVIVKMAEDGVSKPTDFDWLAQLRYYPSEEGIRVRMVSTELYYGYEYMGMQGRLVVTPLTDRCYRTLMGALQLDLGGAPEGPAGTGKTETTKDLGKAMAIQCVVMNCSDGLDYLAMAKFFKGLAASGSWACFDEFNRIDLEVLSVVAQQILTIQRAKAANATEFVFEGSTLPLKMMCNCFITMNPGYAGRSELPDNLKVLFRTVAMMVPDYAMIGEVMLLSSGYLEARPLARKIVQTYKLCSEQLSAQDHYDYGMRAVMAVLRAAGNLKRSFPDEDENVLMLRSILDVNLPKFLSHDVPLFEGITSDLFPGVLLPKADYNLLKETCQLYCDETNLQLTENFFIKITQLYEMIIVRHGLMIVGYSYGAKTSMYRTLAAAVTEMKARGAKEEAAAYHVLNPKSITMGQLYGQFDPVTHEWSDGVLAVTYRHAAQQEKLHNISDRQWVLLDGPVDAIWIENMNTVLDDNKKLCLMSGEMIGMSSVMSMIFEVQDLAVASPATVSRCGMVYVEPSQIGWQPLLTSWLSTLPESVKPFADKLKNLFGWLVPPCTRFVIKECKSMLSVGIPMTDEVTRVRGLMTQMEALMFPILSDDAKASEVGKNVELWVENLFVFSLVWSVAGLIDGASRPKFDAFFRDVAAGKPPPDYEDVDGVFGFAAPWISFLPSDATCYEYVFNQDKHKWQLWMDTITKEESTIPQTAEFASIIVPTLDTARYTSLLNTLLSYNKPLLYVGPTGTGKTAYVQRHILKLPADAWFSVFVNFSAQTSANQAQDIIDSKVDKRRKGVFGPPLGKRAVVFVDDLNMPSLEVYGAQPPIELLRQWMDHGGWFDRKENTFRKLVDLSFVCAMGPPGGGRNPITPRYMRHFNIIAYTAFEDASMQRIFQTIVEWWLRKESFPMDYLRLASPLVGATIDAYKESIANLLPTPSKSHYTFNLRDVARVIQGMLLTSVDDYNKPADLIMCWCHELNRVFYDRLTDMDDCTWFRDMTAELVTKHFDQPMAKLFQDYELPVGPNNEIEDDSVRYLLYCDFSNPKGKRTYKRVESTEGLGSVMNQFLDDYNAISSKPMKLVLFLFAMEHVCRITRVLSMPRGNVLLAGVGGSGRQSATRLAAYICDMDVFTIEVSKSYSMADWREDLKSVLRKAGLEGKGTVFLFADTQIKEEAYLEDINGLLNAGEVPNLFPSDERAQICDGMRDAAREQDREGDGSPTTMFAFFVERCRNFLHICLAMSPIGDAFRRRLRMFPSLVNCCTIDWFRAWPADALNAVASTFLAEVEMESDVRDSVVEMCKTFQLQARDLAERFGREERRMAYVTPTSYLELIQTFQTLLARKRKEVDMVRKRYDNGLDQLNGAGEAVVKMQQELTDLKPQLVSAKEETETMQAQIDKEVKEVIEPKKVVVQAEEAATNEVAQRAKTMKDECEADLAEAIPALNSAIAALDTIKKADIDLVKNMGSPPAGVKLTLEAICVMKDVKPEKIKDKETQKTVEDYFGPGKKLLQDSKAFVDSLKTYDKDNIPPRIIKRIREQYCTNEDFLPEKIAKASSACEGLCKWVRAMEIYDRVAKVVAPKKETLRVAEGEYAEAMKGLAVKQAELREVMDKLATMEAKLADLAKTKQELEAKYDDCNAKLERAEKLMGGLGGEKTRWGEISASLGPKYKRLVGDVLLSSAVIAYLGPFTIPFRRDAVAGWQKLCDEKGVPMSEKFDLQEIVGDPVAIRSWNLQGLPTDSFSIDNGIIISVARRWPLMIDPQGQANKWIRKKEEEAGLLVIKLTQSDYLRTLENAIQFGKPVMCENVLEALDPALEPLLVKQTFKQAGVECIRLGDATIEYSQDFKFYITSKLRNPHYLPELQVKVTLLNFMITPAGLEDQLLGIVVAKERPDLEEEKSRLVLEAAANKKQLKEIEDQILEVLSTGEGGSILEDEGAINILTAAKTLGNEIAEKQKIAEETESKIDEARAGYKPVAYRTSLLFFCIASLADIDPMYQYSLDWFINLFVRAIADSEPSGDLPVRLDSLNSYFQYFLYRNVCRSLFEKDKLNFSMLLCASLLMGYNRMNADEWRQLLTGGVLLNADKAPRNQCKDWLDDKVWEAILTVAQLPAFKDLPKSVANDPTSYRTFIEHPEPHTIYNRLPEYCTDMDDFQKLIILRTLRLDKLVPGISQFVAKELGQQYIEPPPFDLEGTFQDSTNTSPLIFILSPGVDPMLSLLKFAESKGRKVDSISLGQGQGPHAERMVAAGQKSGYWIVLQNCHLYVSWMIALEKIVEEMDPKVVHKNFRLWLTSYPSLHFPVLILQNGVKMTNEPPKGLRANMIQSYVADPISDPEFFDKCQKQPEWRKMLFGLCFLHAWLQERRKYGPLGWNIPYEFNESDLRISVRQLQMFLDNYEETPFAALNYLTAECNYGGRVTDDKDRRTLVTAVLNIYCPAILGDGYKLSSSGIYAVPTEELESHETTVEYIRQWPQIPKPEVFGLHENADITKDLGEVDLMLKTILLTQSQAGGGGGKSTEDVVGEISNDILSKLPKNFDMEVAAKRYPVMYNESMNTVLRQELQRFNNLLSKVRGSLQELGKALKGLVVMSADLESISNAMFINRLPDSWAKVSYPSLKPLSAYITELLDRLAFFKDWLDLGNPVCYPMPHFFFVQAFMTGALQNYARKYTLPIDTVEFDFDFFWETPTEKPEDGVHTCGLFLEGARMGKPGEGADTAIQLEESHAKVLFSTMTYVQLKPVQVDQLSSYPHYECPVYRTTARRGTLSTTGHSTNFVMFIRLPTDRSSSHWIIRGVALINSLAT